MAMAGRGQNHLGGERVGCGWECQQAMCSLALGVPVKGWQSAGAQGAGPLPPAHSGSLPGEPASGSLPGVHFEQSGQRAGCGETGQTGQAGRAQVAGCQHWPGCACSSTSSVSCKDDKAKLSCGASAHEQHKAQQPATHRTWECHTGSKRSDVTGRSHGNRK
ncbi:hypothetical protein HaLaN_27535, partial [Haematococcus lacustris]